MMDLRVQIPVAWISILLVCVWLFMPSGQFNYCDNTGYTVNEFNEDMSKIYYDLGKFSQRRGDFQSAIRSYSIALAHNPEHFICMDNIELCQKKLKENISNAVDFIAKLDSFK